MRGIIPNVDGAGHRTDSLFSFLLYFLLYSERMERKVFPGAGEYLRDLCVFVGLYVNRVPCTWK